MVGVSSPCEEIRMEQTPVSGNQSSRPQRSLGKLISIALNKRVGMGRAISVKQFCTETLISESTYWALARGERENPSGDTVMTLLEYFDPQFAQEISGGVITKIPNRQAAEALQRMHEAHAIFISAIGGRP